MNASRKSETSRSKCLSWARRDETVQCLAKTRRASLWGETCVGFYPQLEYRLMLHYFLTDKLRRWHTYSSLQTNPHRSSGPFFLSLLPVPIFRLL